MLGNVNVPPRERARSRTFCLNQSVIRIEIAGSVLKLMNIHGRICLRACYDGQLRQ